MPGWVGSEDVFCEEEKVIPDISHLTSKFFKIMTNKDNSIALFHEKQVRRQWDEERELWYFSIVDVIEVLTESPRPRKYWNALKTKLEKE